MRSAWPRLGWLAKYDFSARVLAVDHGPFVVVDPQARPRFVAAGVWDGPFAEGAFHRTEHVFGSGVVLGTDGIYFVPPATTLERLLYLRFGHELYVSNSLPLLLAAIGATLRDDYDYERVSESSGYGIDDYIREIPVAHPVHRTVMQVVYDQLVVVGDLLGTRRRTQPHTFASADSYLSALTDIAKRVLENARDPLRRRPVRVVSNVSRGYDSPAITALVTNLCEVDAYCAARSNTRLPAIVASRMEGDVVNDDGTDIAKILGARPRHLELDLGQLPADLERWMWASWQLSPELVFWRMFTDAEAGDALTLWFAGHFGGIWDTHQDERFLRGLLPRSMPSGCSLTEARLRYGLIDCSLAFMFGEDAAAIHALSTSDALAEWRLGNAYDRPISRYVLERRGVPRSYFGYGKRAVAQDFDAPRGQALRAEMFAATGWSGWKERSYRSVNLGLYYVQRAAAFIEARGNRAKMLKLGQHATKNVLRRLGPNVDLRRATFVYCVNTLAAKLAQQSAVAVPLSRARSHDRQG